MTRVSLCSVAIILLIASHSPAAAQSKPPQPVAEEAPTHDISRVDPAPLGGAIAVPLPERDRKRLQKYEIPELVGSRQALGSQLIGGELPKPIVDYNASSNAVEQRLSIFQGGLVVIDVHGAGASIHKKVIIPDDALQNYLKSISLKTLSLVHEDELQSPRDGRRASLRVYDKSTYAERTFDPMSMLPKSLSDQVVPLQDLLRALYQDRTVTNSVAGYMPKPGDQLVGDDRKVYRVVRVIEGKIVELHCTSQPTSIFIDVKDLYNYFIGTPGAASR